MYFSLLFSLTALKNVLYVTVLLFGLAFLMNLVFKLIRATVGRNPKGNRFINYLSAVGVAHHELSHALWYVLTGAKIAKIKLFEVNHEDNTLGYVEAYLRGPDWLRNVQSIMSGLGPVIMGYTSLYLMIAYLQPFLISKGLVILLIPYYYLLACILMHCPLSDVDMKNVITGLKNPVADLFVLLIIYIIVCLCIITNFPILVPAFELMAWIKKGFALLF